MSTTEKKAKTAEPRYFVNSEHIRGESRVYFVVDRLGEWTESSRGVAVTPPTKSKRTAERQCDKLNMKSGE